MEQYILCIDRGSTAVKAVLFDMQGKEVCVSKQKCPPIQNPHHGWSEQDMDNVWLQAAKAIRGITNQFNPKNITCIGVGGQGGGAFLVDDNKKPVRNGILSLDYRSNAICEKWNKNIDLVAMLKKTGQFEFVPAQPLTILYWLKNEEPDSYKKIDKILFSKDWIRLCLTGECATDYTDASGGGLIDIATNEYCYDLMEELNLTDAKRMLPNLKNSTDFAGAITEQAAKETGLIPGTPVITGAHDIAACSVGVGGVSEGHLSIIVGTMGLNLAVESKPQTDYTLTFQGVVPGRWISSTCTYGAGSTLDWCIKTFFENETATERERAEFYERLDSELQKRTPSSLLFYPYLFGNGAKLALGGLNGLGAWHDKYDMFLAAMQGVVYSDVLAMKQLLASKNLTDIWLIGGWSQNDSLCQLFANVLNKRIHKADVKEATSRGVALCVLQSLGVISSFDDAIVKEVPLQRIFEPEFNRVEWYEKHFKLFCDSEKEMQKIWKEQHKLDY